MNDDRDLSVPDDRPLDDTLLSVSAVIDGTADPAELAFVDSSTEAQSLLAELQGHRERLRTVAVPADAAPWSIAAALDVFDREHQPVAPDAAAALAPAGNVVAMRSRRWKPQVLTGMAAALVLVMVGLVVGGGLGGSDSDEASSSTEMIMAAPVDRASDESSSARALPEEAASSAIADTAAVQSAESPSNEPPSTASPAATEAPAAEVGVSSTFTIDNGGATAGTALATPAELTTYAAGRSALVPLEGQTFRCVEGDAQALGTVRYGGVEAIVTRDPVTSTLTAHDLRDCRVLATVTP